ncbi:hypothetical protein QOZ80_6AG0527380 [Eleusine coracana subsp. coracana]|nr:hypothetical protein QOZ80_6AG0527380 [Eleusine coracana subsp. coracana]
MAKKWQRIAALARKRLTSIPAKEIEGLSFPSTSVASKGHCIVYSVDGRLLRQAQEEFGFSSVDGRITLPCDATVMEYMMCLLRRDASEEIETALLSSMVRPCSYGNNGFVQALGSSQQVIVSSF